MADVGDIVALVLDVSPADVTTVATVAVIGPPPLNTLSAPTAVSSVDRTLWTAQLPLTIAGEWRVTWTVTGTGAGVQHDTVYAIGTPSTGEAYATLSDLVAYLNTEPPAGSRQRLIRATAVIDELLVGAVYPVNGSGLPTGTAHITALRDAACAQAQWWVELGDVTGVGISTWWDPLSTESASAGDRAGVAAYGNGKDWRSRSQPLIAPTAVSILRQAGLLPLRAVVRG